MLIPVTFHNGDNPMTRAFLPALIPALIPALAIALPVALTAAPASAGAADDWRFGNDAYMAGHHVELSGAPVGDLFAAGRSVRVSTGVEGSAHMAGQRVVVDAPVGGNVYGAGQDVDIDGPVSGNVSVFGQTVTITEPVSGNLRAAGQTVDLGAPVAGSAVIGGDEVRIGAVIGGDLALSGDALAWGDAARIAGALHIYTDDPEAVEVPAHVAGADQITFHEVQAFDDINPMHGERPGVFARLTGWIGGVLVVGLLGTLLAALAPGFLGGLRARAIARPGFSGVVGAVGISALTGSVVLLAMTGFGILLVPLPVLAAVLLGIAGYVVGTYALGVWAVGAAGRGEPATTGERAMAAFAGAALAAAVGLVPFLGWLAIMAVFLIGAGTLVSKVIRLDAEDLAA